MDSNIKSAETELTGAKCLAAADAIRGVFKDLLPSQDLDGSPLDDGLATLRELGAGDGWLFREPARTEVTAARCALLAAGLGRCMRFAHPVVAARKVPGLANLLKHIRNLNPMSPATGAGHAWNILLEVEVAAACLGFDATVAFAEPDVVLRDGAGRKLSIACKRPRSEDSARQALRRALAQCERAGRQSIVVCTDLVTPPGVTVRGKVRAQSEYRKQIDRSFGRTISWAHSFLATASHSANRRVLGVIFGGWPLFLWEDSGGDSGWLLLPQFRSRLLSNSGVPDALAAR